MVKFRKQPETNLNMNWIYFIPIWGTLQNIGTNPWKNTMNQCRNQLTPPRHTIEHMSLKICMNRSKIVLWIRFASHFDLFFLFFYLFRTLLTVSNENSSRKIVCSRIVISSVYSNTNWKRWSAEMCRTMKIKMK